MEAATSPALAACEHNTAVVGVMMEVSPVSELPRVLTQRMISGCRRLKQANKKHSHFERLNYEEFSSQSVNIQSHFREKKFIEDYRKTNNP